MTTRAAISCLAACCVAILVPFDGGVVARQPPQPSDEGDRVVLITLDGARTQEMFGGLDLAILKSTLKEGQSPEAHPTYRRFWADTPEERRRKLMPFFWGTLMRSHGSIAGHRALGSVVSVTNRHWFSYPGYSEILVGEAHDDLIKSNDPIRNPHTTVLEVSPPPSPAGWESTTAPYGRTPEHRFSSRRIRRQVARSDTGSPWQNWVRAGAWFRAYSDGAARRRPHRTIVQSGSAAIAASS